jgi:TIR domain/Sulfatase-modifying factor enzyme 1
VWLDKEKLLPGADWELEIRRAVRESDVVVVCLSNQFNQAGFRQKEVRLALDTAMEKPEGEIFIIPARLEECDSPESLRKWHWVDLFEDDGHEMLMRALRVRAFKIGATLRIRRSGKSITSPASIKGTEETSEASVNIVPQTKKAQDQYDEKAERETAEKNAREKLERDADEKLARERAEQENTAKIFNEEAERKAADKAARGQAELGAIVKTTQEKEKRYNAYKIAREKAEREAAYKKQATQKQPASKSFPAWLGILGIIVIIITGVIVATNQHPSIPVPAATARFTATPTLRIGSSMVSPKDDMKLLYVPASNFLMGSTDADTFAYSNEKPQHTVYLDAFWIDQTDATNAMYAKYVSAGAYSKLTNPDASGYYGNSQFDNYPMSYVDWNMADAYCKWANRQLPT